MQNHFPLAGWPHHFRLTALRAHRCGMPSEVHARFGGKRRSILFGGIPRLPYPRPAKRGSVHDSPAADVLPRIRVMRLESSP